MVFFALTSSRSAYKVLVQYVKGLEAQITQAMLSHSITIPVALTAVPAIAASIRVTTTPPKVAAPASNIITKSGEEEEERGYSKE
jgi:putative effector of murein hydrolase